MTVAGGGNTVRIATVGSIVCTGTGNTVIWHSGIGGNAPQVNSPGTPNYIHQG